MVDRLIKCEQETIINYNREEDEASIFTYDRKLQKHLENKLGVKPIMENSHGGKGYGVDKSWIRMPQKKRRCSETSKKQLAERFRRSNSEVKNGISSGEN